ncbi:MAG TPA: efflux RND transporter periplasmic adaptor subunit [Ferruginibacter sp.]|nr:efflux RND transporter periplasmic adaptor subunit [Ferruginibacter sp.]HMP21419.1 efflux RND transporter periplasmic adaptor subunit [Ferruginibacter sp.]
MKAYLFIPGIMGLFFFTSCSEKKETTVAETFEVIAPVHTDTVYEHNYIAEIQSVKYVEIRSRVKGYLEKIFVDEGQMVNEGQVLFTISSLEYEKELQKAVAIYKNAIAELKTSEVELANVKSLMEKNIIAKSEYEMAKAKTDAQKAKVEEAKANQEQAELNVGFSKIKAPYKGIINRIPNKTGSLINEGDMLTSISDNKEVFAYFNLSENDYLSYVSNKKEESKIVSLQLANNELYPYNGKIEIVESEFDRSTGNIAFRARFPNPDGLLKHGANGKVVVTKNLNKALVIPQKSTFEIQDKVFVYVVKNDSTLEQRNITPLLRLPHLFVVESGITPSDKIVYEGVQNAKDGMKINPIPAPEKPLASLD